MVKARDSGLRQLLKDVVSKYAECYKRSTSEENFHQLTSKGDTEGISRMRKLTQ